MIMKRSLFALAFVLCGFVAGLESAREDCEMQRGGARRDGERMLDLADAGDERLELGDLRAHREHAALEDLGHLGELGLAELRPT